MGRPSKLTPELQYSICQRLNMGVTVEIACRREGISQDTYYAWVKRGRAGEEPFAEFVDATEQAKAEVECDVTANIITASKRRWQAGAWWLKWRASHGVQRVELTGKDGQPLSGQLTPESADAIRERILYGEGPRKQLAAGGESIGELASHEQPDHEVRVIDDDDTSDDR